jgi:hypothetical protein
MIGARVGNACAPAVMPRVERVGAAAAVNDARRQAAALFALRPFVEPRSVAT